MANPDEHEGGFATTTLLADPAPETVRALEQLFDWDFTESLDHELSRAERLDRRADWLRTIRDSVLDVVNSLPAGAQNWEALQLAHFLIKLQLAVDGDEDARDTQGNVRLAAAQMTDICRRLERCAEHASLDDADVAAAFVFNRLEGIPTRDIAVLFGVSPRAVSNWRNGSPVGTNDHRVKLVARLTSYLRPSLTATGLHLWFETEADMLEGRSPLELIDEGAEKAWVPLVRYARGSRGQLAA